MSKTRVKRSTRFVSSCCRSPSYVLYVGAVFACASVWTSARHQHQLHKVGPAIGPLNVIQPLPEESGSPSIFRAPSRSASWLSSPIIRLREPIDSEILVIVTALTLAWQVLVVRCALSTFYVRLSVLTSRLGIMTTFLQSPQAFMICPIDYWRIAITKGCQHFNCHHRYLIEAVIPCIAASAHHKILF